MQNLDRGDANVVMAKEVFTKFITEYVVERMRGAGLGSAKTLSGLSSLLLLLRMYSG